MDKKYTSRQYAKDLKNIKLVKLIFIEINSNIELENISEDGSIMIESKNSVQFLTKEEENSFAVVDKYQFFGLQKKVKTFEISMKVMAIFDCDNKMKKDFYRIFEKNTLKIITYPYIRQAVHDIAQKMGLPPLVLPIWTSVVKT